MKRKLIRMSYRLIQQWQPVNRKPTNLVLLSPTRLGVSAGLLYTLNPEVGASPSEEMDVLVR